MEEGIRREAHSLGARDASTYCTVPHTHTKDSPHVKQKQIRNGERH